MSTDLRGVDLAETIWNKIHEIPDISHDNEAYSASDIKEAWDQKTYYSHIINAAGKECGTAACFAGWACIMVDGKDAFNKHLDYDSSYHIESRAAELLGIKDDGEIEELFNSANDVKDIQYALENIYGREFRTPDSGTTTNE
jgi:hypothetical protein